MLSERFSFFIFQNPFFFATYFLFMLSFEITNANHGLMTMLHKIIFYFLTKK